MREPEEFRVDIGDVELSLTEWAGDSDPVLLLHATGFHSRCWNQVIKQLPGSHVYAVDLRFHGGSGDAGEVDWNLLAEDIRLLIAQLDLKNLVGAGHSLGGYLIARAAAHAPERFKHLILIDPVIMSPEHYTRPSAVLDGVQAHDHPVSRRKNQWRDADEMFQRFKDRPPFNSWQPEVLRDYCDYALCPTEDDALNLLACDPINEASVYLNQKKSGDIHHELASIHTPTTLLRAPPGHDATLDLSSSPTWPALARALPNCEDVYLPHCNHFIPMQDPALVAQHIRAALTGR
jgi:pimeloyl-ACP methyl ester carboxylesterase